ncbi:DUF3500 domain-containing protein [Microlunatus antarcticus]|uniref:DUF3500 domain-containing protein n=1 Tax=Microlunatus antarcticus TaxID=53388 RepID=A0A7W5JXS0_9ACTN|nr:DUF3500 domain-containing protein [Microlunatus antarcticus]MBB3328244.1 hypothetical protein [Microlunatus antarcticus]
MTSKNSLRERPLSRRWFLGIVPVAVAGLAACSGSTIGPASSSASSTASAASSAVATGAAAAGSVAAFAQAFYKTLTPEQQPTVLLDYSLATAERWSNLPQGLLGGSTGGGGGMPSGMPSGGPDGDGSGRPSGMPSGGPAGGGSGGAGGGSQSRVGLSLGDLTEDQLAAFTAMIKAATGSGTGTGYDAIEQHLNADDYLAANGGGDDYGRKNYYVALLGSPQDSGTWELQFGGHHLAVANTYTDGQLAGATPSFRGIEPNGAFDLDGRTNEPMKVKEAAFTALLTGLGADQLAKAKLSDTFTDLVLTPGKDWAFPTSKEGVQVSEFSAAQQKLVTAAIASYVEDIADADAKTILARYSDELADTYVAYAGTVALTEQNDYVRIDGPSVWIEFSMQHGIVLAGNHPHSVWRDRTTDYGGTRS